LNSRSQLFLVGLISMTFLGCGKSTTPALISKPESDSVPQQGPQVLSNASREETNTHPQKLKPNLRPAEVRNQMPSSEGKWKNPVSLDDAVDIIEFAQSKGLSENVDALTLIQKAGDSDHVLAGTWKLTMTNLTCADGLLEGSPGVPVTDGSELWLCARIPFRLYIPKGPFGESRINSIKGARKVVAARHEIRSQPCLLTENSTLRPCSVQEYQALIIQDRTDNLFYSESTRAQVLIAGQFNPKLRAILEKNKPLKDYSMTIYFRDLKHSSSLACQHSWGFYRSGALREHDWDSDDLMTWNTTGAFTGMVPDYFHTDPAKSPMMTSAMLFAILLLDPEGHVLASADWN